MSNGGSRLMAPMTALRMVDIPSNAARLAPKPMSLNVAKRARMNIRRQKRAITWTDLSCRGRFGSCAKFQDPDGCALHGPPDTIAGRGTQQAATSVRSRLYAKLSVRTGSLNALAARGTLGTPVLLD